MSGLSRNQYRKSALRLQIAPRLKHASQSAVRTSRNAPAAIASHLHRAHRTHTAHRTCTAQCACTERIAPIPHIAPAARAPRNAPAASASHPYRTSHLQSEHRAFQLQIAPRSKRASQSAARAPRNAPAPSASQCTCTEHRNAPSVRAPRTHTAQCSCSERIAPIPHIAPAARTHHAFQLQTAPRLKHASQSAASASQCTCTECEKADREMRSAFGFYVTVVLHVRPCGRALRSAHLTPSLFSARRKRRSYTYTTVSGARRSLSSRGA